MTDTLKNRRIAVVATDGFEQSELVEPMKALRQEGATAEIISLKLGRIQGMVHHDKGDMHAVDRTLDQARPQDYDALVLPGGVANPDTLRIEPKAIAFIRHFIEQGKPIAAICHGPWTLIEAGGVKSRTMTSWPSLKTDLANAGAKWVDQAVVVDQGLVTSRKPDDLPQFCARMVEEFAEGRHPRAAE
jgi:protease I